MDFNKGIGSACMQNDQGALILILKPISINHAITEAAWKLSRAHQNRRAP